MTLARTPLAAFGVVLTTTCALLFLLAVAADAWGLIDNPYVGLLIFGALPVGFAAGLALILTGNLLARRRGTTDVRWPVIDLGSRGQRVFVMGLIAASLVNVVIFAMAGYGAIHYMETPAFCGQVCHQVMTPEYVAHAEGAHARVSCVSCHVGPGAGALAQSKLDGLRRLRAFVSGHVTRPIPAPVADMRPARETCATCHWPDRIHGDRLTVVREYADDEASTETITTLELRVGGGDRTSAGIHWHANPATRIEFVARDAARQDIPWVRLTAADGSVTDFRAPGLTDDEIAAGTRRTMDCTDCHNRPSHTFSASAERATDAAIAQGRVSRLLPFARREVVKALKVEAATQADALTAIDRGLRTFYAGAEGAERPAAADVDGVVMAAQAVYRGNVFPEMRITWGTYPNNLGHLDAPGCFRCHDGEKAAANGRTIGQDCETCHRMR